MNAKYLDEIVTQRTYPSGETHLWLHENTARPWIVIADEVRNFNDLAQVALLDRISKRRRAGGYMWFIPFFPFARDDRREDANQAFELDLAMHMLDGVMAFTLDPHSDVLGNMLPHIPQRAVVEEFRRLINYEHQNSIHCELPTTWVIPDAGAIKKAHTWLRKGDRFVVCSKYRDPSTGELSNIGVSDENGLVSGSNCVIVDDICDGGGTFFGISARLREMGAGRVDLAVTHGLFTKGVETLLDEKYPGHLDHIYTTGRDPYGESRVSVVDLENFTTLWKEAL